MTVQAAVDAFSQQLNTLKAHQGIASIDWHVRTSFPGSTVYRDWGNAYLGILEVLAGDTEVTVMTCTEAAALSRPPR